MTNAFLTRITAPVGHILHIGAGTGSDIPDYLDASPAAVTLIEPDPGALPKVQQAAQGHDNFQVIEAAISPDPKAGPLHRFTFGDLNSLRAPTGLRDLFPGLEELDSEPVTLRDPVVLVEGLDLDPDRAHVLVIEAPGEALAIVQALDTAGLLARFTAVRVQEGQEPLYEGAGTLPQVQAVLTAAGFSLDAPIDDTDPERPILSVMIDRVALRQQALEGDLEQLRAERDQLDKAADDLKAALTKARRENGRIKASLTRRDKAFAVQQQTLGSFEARVAELEGEQVTLARELEARAARITELTASGDQQRQDFEAALEQVKGQLATQEAAYTAAQEAARARAAELEDEQAAALKQAETAAAAHQASEARVAALEGEQATLARELEARTAKITELTASGDTQRRDFEAALEQMKDQLATQEAALARELEEQRAADHQRLALSREDMLRAEGQIEIIKDLLLRGPEL